MSWWMWPAIIWGVSTAFCALYIYITEDKIDVNDVPFYFFIIVMIAPIGAICCITDFFNQYAVGKEIRWRNPPEE